MVVFNDFANITQELEVITHLSPTIGKEDPIDKAIKKYENYPSIKKIKECYTCSESFYFRKVTVEGVFYQIGKLNHRKSSPV